MLKFRFPIAHLRRAGMTDYNDLNPSSTMKFTFLVPACPGSKVFIIIGTFFLSQFNIGLLV